jgi:hypothetical protein
MFDRIVAVSALSLILASGALAKKKEQVLPEYVLSAHTIAVVIDPSAGMNADDPRANQVAQKDVEDALLKWGRFTPMINPKGADIVVVVRRGNRRAVNETISDPTQNNRAGVINRTDGGVQVGGQRSGGLPNGPGSGFPGADQGDSLHPQLEIGGTDDSFVVRKGDAVDPFDSPVAWRYEVKDGLRPHEVPAVEEFRKALAAADKAAAAAAASKKP